MRLPATGAARVSLPKPRLAVYTGGWIPAMALSPPTPRLPKMMLGFVVRRCTVDLGRRPTPEEFAAWANAGSERRAHLFGRPISEAEARLLLAHQGRLVSARSASAEERYVEADPLPEEPANLVRLTDVRARRSGR